MGFRNDTLYLKQKMPAVPLKRVIEIGSKDHGNTENFRSMLACEEFVGVDMEPGKGVDWVGDANDAASMPPGEADLLICCSVLEHTPTPWIMAQVIGNLVRSRGFIYIFVPWVWRYHPYPDDYWRISFRGIQTLFPDFQWLDQTYSGLKDNDFYPAVRNADNEHCLISNNDKFLPYSGVHSFGRKK